MQPRPTIWDRLRHPFSGVRFLHASYKLRNSPYPGEELGPLIAALRAEGSARGFAAYPHVPLAALVYSANFGGARARGDKLLRQLTADAGLFTAQQGRPLLLIELTHPGFARGKRRRASLLAQVCQGAGLPLARWPVARQPSAPALRDFLAQWLPEDLHAVSAEAPPIAPLCPACGAAMVLRTARKGPAAGNRFWGCSEYPRCAGTRSL